MLAHWFRKKDLRILENKRYFESFERNKALRDYDFTVFDSELTNLAKRSGEIVSIGAVRIRRMQVEIGKLFSENVRPRNTAHTEATLIHRLTPEELKVSPRLEEVMPRFLDFVGKSIIVGHCISIDMEFLDRACRQLYGGRLYNPTIDTMGLARSYYGQVYGLCHGHGAMKKSYNLHALSKDFQLPLFDQHTALGDAIQTAYLFLYLVKKYHAGGLETLQDLYRASRTGTWIDYV